VIIDLVQLAGVEELLGSSVAEPGVYRVIRLHVSEVNSS